MRAPHFLGSGFPQPAEEFGRADEIGEEEGHDPPGTAHAPRS
jgi:hypothetical protein